MTRVIMKYWGSRGVIWVWLVALGCLLAACSSVSLNRAPVEDRYKKDPTSATSGAVIDSPRVKQSAGVENAGKAGYYTVKPGDTLLKIALENGQPFRDLASWNQLENPNRIEVGQVLRVIPPLGNEVVVKPVPKAAATASPASAPAPAHAVVTTTAVAPASTPASATAPTAEAGTTHWIWPVNGVVVAEFDEVKNKGIDFAGKAGDAVLAVADGRVVYVGAGLRGYGNLIILKHDNVYLTAYAHNRTLLVKEDQSVLKGQKIAEMGNSDTDRVKLHFEVRRQGKPVDPVKYLPPR